MSKILSAIQFAKARHKDQTRKYTGESFILHPARVALRVSLLPDVTDNMICAAWLHDTIEDGVAKAHEILKSFGNDVYKLVNQLTNLDRERLKTVSREAKLIKLADRIDNLNDMEDASDDFKELYIIESELLYEEVLKGLDDELDQEFEAAITNLQFSFATT